MNLAGIRNRSLVTIPYERLISRGLSHDKALQFAKGYVALKGNDRILSAEGRQLLSLTTAFLGSKEPISNTAVGNRFDELLPKLPSVRDPKLFLFVSPSANLSEAEKGGLIKLFNDQSGESGEGDYRIVQVSQGCPNQCLICGVDAPDHMIHMPYPMVLAVLENFLNPAQLYNLTMILTLFPIEILLLMPIWEMWLLL